MDLNEFDEPKYEIPVEPPKPFEEGIAVPYAQMFALGGIADWLGGVC